jgi:hypothetical protein
MFIEKLTETASLLLCLILLTTTSLNAGDTGKLAGKITDSESGEPLVGCNVIITGKWAGDVEEPLNLFLGSSTDMEGDYYILNIPPGEYTVKASYVGYQPQIITRVQIKIDITTRLDFQLSLQSIQTEEVVVKAFSTTKVEIDVTATKQTYNISQMEGIAGVADIADILELQADVIDDHFRGGRVGEALYLIGGGTIVNPLDKKRAFNPIVIGLEQVEVYTSGFSAEYGNAQSGVVNMVAKEGGNQWESRLEMSTTPPQYKTWNGSPYSPQNLYFYNTLLNTEVWLAENPTQPGRSLFDPGYGFGSVYLPERNVWPPNPLKLEDSLKIARLGQISWMQSIRSAGLEYDNTYDYRVDFSTGGPLSDKLKIFIAGRENKSWPIIPTPNADLSRQLITNFSYQANANNKLKFRVIYDYKFANILTSNWLRWLFDRTFSVSKSSQITTQFGADWQHILNPSTYFDVRFSMLNTSLEEKVELLAPGQFIEEYANKTNWVDYTGPSAHRVGRLNDDSGDDKTRSYDFSGSFTNQVNKQNLIKAGLQFTYYDLNVNRDMNFFDAGGYRKVQFEAFPYEGALFVQDKLEFEGLIANVGLRLDFYNLNASYFADIYSPLRNPYYDESKPYLERGFYYDQDLAAKEESKLYSKLQPRIGISFPISEYSVFHINYGTFTQRPSFSQIFYSQVTRFNEIEILGNPRLKPENTKAYDIGLVNSFPIGIKLDVSAYYKDVTNLVQTAYYFDQQQTVYRTYINRDYADIKGFHVSVEMTESQIKGYIRYNYEAATGKSSNDLNAPVTYFENPAVGQEAIELPDPEDVYLDYDRTHKAVVNLRYKTPKTFGFNLGNFYPLADLNFSVTFKLYTGRPYTYDVTGQGLKFNKRTPTERDLRLRIEKSVPLGKNNLVIYGEGFNLLNQEIYHYSRTFDSERNTVRWENQRENVLVYDEYIPYVTDQSVYLLSNLPRYFRFGIIYKF